MKKNKILIIGSIVVLAFSLILTISYSYFTIGAIAGKNVTTSVESALNLTYTITGNNNAISLNLSSTDLVGATNYLESSSSSTFTVTLNNQDSGHSTITCNYKIYYTPSVKFTNSANNTSNLKELTLYSASNGGVELDLHNKSSKTLVGSYTISDSNAASATTQTWIFKLRHYILENINQNDNYGKSFAGKVTFEAGNCS